jgi:uncharacterized protein (DUF1778 family)
MRRLLLPIIKKPEKKVQLSFRFEPEIIDKLKKIAEREEVTVTFVLESLLKFAIDAWESEKGIDLNKDSK